MTNVFKMVSFVTVASLAFALFASVLPYTTYAINAPHCVFNAIVQPSNNGGTTLSWKVYDAHTIEITGIGIVSDADALVVYPSTQTSYTLTATGSAGVDTCTVVAQPVSSYSFGTSTIVSDQTCEMWVNPDYVVSGGTGILSWKVLGVPRRVSIDNGIGNVGDTGSRVIPNNGVAQNYTLIAEWPNGNTRTCSATLRPTTGVIAPSFTGGVQLPGAYVYQTPGAVLPGTTPYITATYTQPTVALSQVPYTGTNDVVYVLTLLVVSIGAFALLFSRRESLSSVLASFSPTDNDDFEVAVEQAVIHEA